MFLERFFKKDSDLSEFNKLHPKGSYRIEKEESMGPIWSRRSFYSLYVIGGHQMRHEVHHGWFKNKEDLKKDYIALLKARASLAPRG